MLLAPNKTHGKKSKNSKTEEFKNSNFRPKLPKRLQKRKACSKGFRPRKKLTAKKVRIEKLKNEKTQGKTQTPKRLQKPKACSKGKTAESGIYWLLHQPLWITFVSESRKTQVLLFFLPPHTMGN